ncbi:hypothetical protein GCM10010400_25730 [Streptomyces aculeolatus]
MRTARWRCWATGRRERPVASAVSRRLTFGARRHRWRGVRLPHPGRPALVFAHLSEWATANLQHVEQARRHYDDAGSPRA